jgi:hypothetical protein
MYHIIIDMFFGSSMGLGFSFPRKFCSTNKVPSNLIGFFLDHNQINWIIFIISCRHKSTACSPAYKDAVDNIWRQLVLLQQMGYVIWAQALQIKGWPSGHIGKLYAKRTSEQVKIFVLFFFLSVLKFSRFYRLERNLKNFWP